MLSFILIVNLGSCPENSLLSADQCKFAHHWIPDTTDVLDEESLELENAFQVLLKEDGPVILIVFLIIVTLIVTGFKMALRSCSSKRKQKTL